MTSNTDTPRIGVFVCHCGSNIAGYLSIDELVEYAKGLPHVEYVQPNLYTCSEGGINEIKRAIKEQNLNRVVVASCTPRTHEPLFRSSCQEAGLNPYLFEMVNIRDQCSWVHMATGRGHRQGQKPYPHGRGQGRAPRAAGAHPESDGAEGAGHRRRHSRYERRNLPGPHGIRSGAGGKDGAAGRHAEQPLPDRPRFSGRARRWCRTRSKRWRPIPA